jgi:hypothetical protein
MPVEIQVGPGDMAELVRRVADIKNGVPKVLVPAINRALAAGRTTIRREIRKEYTIKQKDIPVRLKKASYANVGGSIIIESGMLPLDHFKVTPRGYRKRKRPLYAQVKKTGGGFLPGSFYIPRGGPYRRIGPSRHPIFLLRTIGAAIMASQPTVGPEANKAMGDTLAKRVDHELERVLAKG